MGNKQAKGAVGTGIAVMIRRGDLVLVGQRQGSHMAGSWCFPGGHLDFGESWTEAAHREVQEETGLVIENVKVVAIANNLMGQENLQYTTVYLEATSSRGEPELKEPHKCLVWRWVKIDEIPSPHMTPAGNLFHMGYALADQEVSEVCPAKDFVLVDEV